MGVPRLLSRSKVRRLSDLESIAFPDHEISLPELRRVAYRLKAGKGYPPEFTDHLQDCTACQRELRILTQIDPLLTGEEDRQFDVFIEAVQNPVREREIEQRAKKMIVGLSSVGTRARGVASAAAAFVTALLPEAKDTADLTAQSGNTENSGKKRAAHR